MTTTVRILIEGNKACEVSVYDPDTEKINNGPGAIKAMNSDIPVKVMPGSFTTKLIHGKQIVCVKETGDYLT